MTTKVLTIEQTTGKCYLCGSSAHVSIAQGPIGYTIKICDPCIAELSKKVESKLLLTRATDLVDQATLLVKKTNQLDT